MCYVFAERGIVAAVVVADFCAVLSVIAEGAVVAQSLYWFQIKDRIVFFCRNRHCWLGGRKGILHVTVDSDILKCNAVTLGKKAT